VNLRLYGSHLLPNVKALLSKRIEDIVAMEENINSNKVGKLPRLPAGICATVCAGRKKREKKKNAFLHSIFLLLCYFMHN
jgi:hypothetical protein